MRLDTHGICPRQLLYARGVADVLRASGDPRDGAALAAAMRGAAPFEGMSGRVRMDPETGDRETDVAAEMVACRGSVHPDPCVATPLFVL